LALSSAYLHILTPFGSKVMSCDYSMNCTSGSVWAPTFLLIA